MTQASALVRARGLREAMLDHGCPQVSIELQPGRPSPYDDWDGQFVVVNMSHHTASRFSLSNLTPCLYIIKHGRKGSSPVPGPLANDYAGWDLIIRLITMGYANHPGQGGPHRTSKGYVIPQDSARRYAFGTEFEGGITASDWDRVLVNRATGKKMSMRELMGRHNAAVQDFFKIPLADHLEHSTWARPIGRKIDRQGYSRDGSEGRAEIRKYSGSSTPAAPSALPPAGTYVTPVDRLGRPVMSYSLLQVAGQRRDVSGKTDQFRHQAVLSLKALGKMSRSAPDTQFPEGWTRLEQDIDRDHVNSVPDEWSFEYFVDRCAYWPPDGSPGCWGVTNDWPRSALDR